MKKITITLLMSFFFINCFAQDYTLVYTMEQVAKNINLKTTINTYLEGNGVNSIYLEDFKDSKSKGNKEDVQVSINENNIFFKDLKKNTFYYSDHIRFQFYNIHDNFNKIEWTILNETKEILGYNCQKATCEFRGRKYDAFYAIDIPISDGPWKLTGLPGIILEVLSDDAIASFKIIVTEINLASNNTSYKNSYAGKEKITYSEFKSLYKNKYEESLYKIVNEKGETRPMSKGFREYYIE